MYDDGNATYRVGINWKDILIKIVLLILFIILLLVLFPKVDLTGLNDTIYNSNIQTMKEAARNYYTVDRLPSQVGETSSMTLKEMINNHRIIEFRDKNGNFCDESESKVEVTKISNTEYALKVVLNCDDKKDYILDTIGCTNICSNGTCQTVITNGNGSVASNTNPSNNNDYEDDNSGNGGNAVLDDTDYDSYEGNSKDGILKKKVIYYQHKKAIVTTKTVYTCPSGYTKTKGNKCIKNSTGAEIDATPIYGPDKVITTDAKYNYSGDYTVYADPIKTKTGTNYTCPSGYTLNGSYCIKYTDATEHPGKTTYTCPTGYTLSGTTCTKVYDATYHSGSTNYSCPQGGTLSGTTCTLTTSPTTNTTYTCPSGYTQNGSSCYKVYNATASTSYSCPSGYTQSGSTCYKTYNATASTTYSCPSGYTKSGSGSSTTCTKTTTSSYAATPKTTYGSWVNQGTKYYTSSSKAYTGDTSKLVYGGMISGAVCGSPCGNAGIWYKYTYYTRSASTTYSCPNGGTLSGTNCVKTSTVSANPTTSTSYSCPNGGTLSGSTCKITTNATSKTTYSCPSGGTLSGSTCTLTTNATPTTTYTCPSGYTKSGSGSSTTCTKTYSATPSTGDGYYTCPNGGTLSGSKCTLTTNATPTTGEPTYTCPTGYTLNGKVCEYKIPATGTDVYSYTCPTGYTQTGTGENTKCSKVVKGENVYYCEDADAKLSGTKCIKTVKGDITGYTCPTDYTLNGTKCIKKTTIEIDATAKTTKKTSYKYTWSKKSKLAGWEFTGKTKVVYEKYVAGQK